MVITGIVQTIGEHITSEQTLAGGDEGVGVEEWAPFGVIITALEIIESGFRDMLVATKLFLRPLAVSNRQG
jgi:hypothetical protein